MDVVEIWEWLNKNGVVTLVATSAVGVYSALRANKNARDMEVLKATLGKEAIEHELDAKHRHEKMTDAITRLFTETNKLQLALVDLSNSCRPLPTPGRLPAIRNEVSEKNRLVGDYYSFLSSIFLYTPQELAALANKFASLARNFTMHLSEFEPMQNEIDAKIEEMAKVVAEIVTNAQYHLKIAGDVTRRMIPK